LTVVTNRFIYLDNLPMTRFRMRILPLAFAASVAVTAMIGGAEAKGSGTESVGKAVAIALPLVAGGISAYKEDWNGLADVATVTLATVGTTYLINHVVKEKRPDGSDYHSFPSNTTGLAFAPSFYLWHRYGWEYGVPAVAAASFVAYSRVNARKHHWYDVATSAAIAFGYDQIFTWRYRGTNISSGVYATPDAGYVSVNYRW
jgi:membrane-associated phospholipid phosphatase